MGEEETEEKTEKSSLEIQQHIKEFSLPTLDLQEHFAYFGPLGNICLAYLGHVLFAYIGHLGTIRLPWTFRYSLPTFN